LKEYNRTRSRRTRKYLCYLPFTQLYVSFEGNIYVCCGNRSFLLGKYPEQSLKDVWFGDALRELRKRIIDADLTKGCQICLEPLRDGNYDLVLARRYDAYGRHRGKYPVAFELELSNTCNLACIMCYSEFSSTVARRLDPHYQAPASPYDAEFVRQFEAFIPHLHEITFKGGEPFLIPIYRHIWRSALALNPSVLIRIITNATALTPVIEELLLRSNFHLNVSIDSLRKDRYEQIRRNADFEQTLGNVRRMIELDRRRGGGRLTIMVCFMTVNWDEMPDLVAFCNDNRVNILFLHITYPALHLSVRHAGPRTQEHIYRNLSQVSLPEGKPVQSHNKSVYGQLLTQLHTWMQEARILPPDQVLATYKRTLDSALSSAFLLPFQGEERLARHAAFSASLDAVLDHGRRSQPDFPSMLAEMPPQETIDLVLSENSPEDICRRILDHYRHLLGSTQAPR